MRLLFNREEAADFRDLVSRFDQGAFASPYRSTLPLLALVKDEPRLFREIVAACGCNEDVSVHFEYQVSVPGVEGNPSQTDAMVVGPSCTLALEAKWTESRYETVSKRLSGRIAKLIRADPGNAERHTAAQRAVIAAWLSLLAVKARRPIAIEQAGAAVYQMIHRAASGCAMPGASALVYLHFGPSPDKQSAQHSQYRADLAHLREIMGKPESFPFYLVELPLRPTTAFGGIKDLPKRKWSTVLQVRAALADERLFEFGDPQIEQVS